MMKESDPCVENFVLLANPRACEECCRKKIGCDRQRPVCGLCQRVGSACNFPLHRKPPAFKVQKGTKRAGNSNVHRSRTGLESVIQQYNAFTSNQQTPLAARKKAPTLPISQSLGSVHCEDQLTSAIPDLTRHEVFLRYPGIEQNGEEQNMYKNDTDTPLAYSQARMSISSICSSPGSLNYMASGDYLKLIDLYFARIQSWLPLFHRPRFYARYVAPALIEGQPLSISNLSIEEQLVFEGIFALSARYSEAPKFADTAPRERGEQFAVQAKILYEAMQLSGELSSITSLQGCILLAYYYFASGPISDAWKIICRCVELVYELDLHSVDADGRCATEIDPQEWILREECRRAWWNVWELDIVSSILSGRPCMIDRRRMMVHLPCSDEAWFTQTPISSARLLPEAKDSWSSLASCPNQDPRAWFLIVTYLSSVAHGLAKVQSGVSLGEKQDLDIAFCCLRLSLPPSFYLKTNPFHFEISNFGQGNWIIAVQLILATTNMILSMITEEGATAPSQQNMESKDALFQAYLKELVWVISKWPRDFIDVAHPFLCTLMIPIYVIRGGSEAAEALSLAKNLPKLVLANYARVWTLGSAVQDLNAMIEYGQCATKKELELARYFAGLLPRELRRTRRGSLDLQPLSSSTISSICAAEHMSSTCTRFPSRPRHCLQGATMTTSRQIDQLQVLPVSENDVNNSSPRFEISEKEVLKTPSHWGRDTGIIDSQVDWLFLDMSGATL